MMGAIDHLLAAAEAQKTATPGPWSLSTDGRTVYALTDERVPRNRFSAQVQSHPHLTPPAEMNAVADLFRAVGSIPFAKVLAVVEAAAWRQELLEAIEFCRANTAGGAGVNRIMARWGLGTSLRHAEAELSAALAELEVER